MLLRAKDLFIGRQSVSKNVLVNTVCRFWFQLIYLVWISKKKKKSKEFSPDMKLRRVSVLGLVQSDSQ